MMSASAEEPCQCLWTVLPGVRQKSLTLVDDGLQWLFVVSAIIRNTIWKPRIHVAADCEGKKGTLAVMSMTVNLQLRTKNIKKILWQHKSSSQTLPTPKM